MTIKKPISVRRPAATKPAPEKADAGLEPVAETEEKPSAPPAATIADRFKLEAPVEKKRSSGGPAGIGTKIAVVAALIALALAGFLAFTLFQGWEFLKDA